MYELPETAWDAACNLFARRLVRTARFSPFSRVFYGASAGFQRIQTVSFQMFFSGYFMSQATIDCQASRGTGAIWTANTANTGGTKRCRAPEPGRWRERGRSTNSSCIKFVPCNVLRTLRERQYGEHVRRILCRRCDYSSSGV